MTETLVINSRILSNLHFRLTHRKDRQEGIINAIGWNQLFSNNVNPSSLHLVIVVLTDVLKSPPRSITTHDASHTQATGVWHVALA